MSRILPNTGIVVSGRTCQFPTMEANQPWEDLEGQRRTQFVPSGTYLGVEWHREGEKHQPASSKADCPRHPPPAKDREKGRKGAVK